MRKHESEPLCNTDEKTKPRITGVLTGQFARIEALESPDSSVGHGQQHANIYYDQDLAHPAHEVDDFHAECPPSTTERKLIAKIDLRVIPLLTLMYLLAFLDRYDEKAFDLSREHFNFSLTVT